jgi:hypothetical protein
MKERMAEYVALVRISQLFVASILVFCCIYMGYRLFAQIPINITDEGKFKMPKIDEVSLKVAPGIFFAVLGAAIIVFSIEKSIEVSSRSGFQQAKVSNVQTNTASPLFEQFNQDSESPPARFDYSQSQGKAFGYENR